MSQPPSAEIVSAEADAATRRLMIALDTIEEAVGARREAERGDDEVAARIHGLALDRSRLADELDRSLARARRLEHANREMMSRLDAAIAQVRAALGEDKAS